VPKCRYTTKAITMTMMKYEMRADGFMA